MARFSKPIYALIISGLAISVFPNICKAQITNELCFNELVGDFLSTDSRKFSGVDGFRTPALEKFLDSTAGANYRLRIDPPSVNYEKLKGAQFAREVSAELNFVDSTDHLTVLTWRDTIQRREIPATRKTKISELKGSDPRWFSKYLVPAAFIGVGITGIISLFYIRSS
jgi:hypothetical protein